MNVPRLPRLHPGHLPEIRAFRPQCGPRLRRNRWNNEADGSIRIPGLLLRLLPPSPISRALLLWLLLSTTPCNAADRLRLPTDNQALFDADGGGPRLLVGTVGKPWTSGAFGCVRSDGWQFHEGLDIRATRYDAKGEATDAVRAAADGTVMYLSDKAALSNYGKYIILLHQIDGLPLYSLYAHLASFTPGLRAGAAVKAGDRLATLGRTSNTRQGISKDRAHVHFELNLLLNPRFPDWYRKNFPSQRNDHGAWNGQNLVGMDPAALLLAQKNQGNRFNLSQWLTSRPQLCRVLVRQSNLAWAQRHPQLVTANPRARQEGVAGYELALAYNGLPVRITPRAAAEIRGKSPIQLLEVNEAEQRARPCRKIVRNRNGRWELAPNGQRLIDLLTF